MCAVMPAHFRRPPFPCMEAVRRLRRSYSTHPLDRALRDAKIVCAKALIKPANALPLSICLIVETLQPKYDPGEEVDVGDATGTNRSEAVSYRHVLTTQIGFVAVLVTMPTMAAAQGELSCSLLNCLAKVCLPLP